jgi:hypothetical protein
MYINKNSLQMQITNRATILLSAVWLLVQPLALVGQAQASPEIIIDRILRADSSSSSTSTVGSTTRANEYKQLLGSFKRWMGAYQRLQKDGDNYVAVFDSGSLPIEVRSKDSGAIESLSFGCPSTKSLSLNEAPREIQQALLKCSGFNRSGRQ